MLFGKQFIRMDLSSAPTAFIQVNNMLSESFTLHKSGYALSPLLWVLALQPLMETIRVIIVGFQRANGKEKLPLYADDRLLFLGDM